ncbi:MAG: ribosome maturation factor RimP [Clostridiales Family XIII bacterium]|jgi:ribosome maturation factor RimP|nr:ribosome maturation factor RimP [Clostridiales Family XIII bacterium]
MSAGKVAKAVEGMMQPLEAEGYELWNVEFAKEGKDKQLRVFVDKAGGITVDDCEAVSRFLSDRLDESGLISEAYSLVVSSPGMDRVLLKDEHFARYAGQPVEVSLYKGFEGRKKFAALLGARTPEALHVTPVDPVTLAAQGEEMRVPIELVSKVNLLVVF